MARKTYYKIPDYYRRRKEPGQLSCQNCIKDSFCHRNRTSSHIYCFSARPVSKYERIKEMSKEEFALFLEGYAKMGYEPDFQKISNWLDEKYMDIGAEKQGEQFDEHCMYGNSNVGLEDEEEEKNEGV